ncbi:3'-5' ssDNA/RNA exonuclease TatD-like isoform X1 [Haliotis rufescens]|uniref:3'-5' ssDNA/RNA exonuclease TatD-like isoform X1 n=1 Tax=Haliotis rufescens TaxID=6454 RepID=UPI00201F35AD|nr:3'-5' ssDNA/RNA exonuclease TatD-like isoform X1 [Haliotis rufescens]XP_048250442.1 3'-5' ssDNA/RNA exonuclease TatD-like isoform X1 [Haliotis rufescens]
MDNEESSSSSSAVKQVVRKTLIIENIGMATTADDLTRCFAPALQKCGKDRPVIQLAIDKKGRSLGYATVTVPLSTVELFLDFNDRYINNDKVRVMMGDKRVGTWQSQGNGVFMSSPARRSTADTVTCNTTFVHSLIDGGMYLRHKKFKVPDHVIAAALTDGTDKLVSLGKSVFESQETLKLSRLFSGAVYCTAGVSPRNAVFWTDETSHQLEEITKSPGCVAIGQCGYDLSTDKLVDTAVPQLQAFEAQIQLAIRLSMPLVVCENKAKSEVMALLTSYKDKLPRVAILATPASQDDITDYLDHGFYFFITGDMWKPGSSSPVWSWLLDCTAEQLTRVILSSQMPMTGCQTSLSSLAEAVATKTGKELEDVRRILRDNTMRFYGLSEVESQGEESGIDIGCSVDQTVNVETNWTYRILLWLAFVSGLAAMYFYGN